MDAATAWAEAMKFEASNPHPYYELRKTPVAKVSEDLRGHRLPGSRCAGT
jgi:hypothetical protein